jgi:hypothetical protein
LTGRLGGQSATQNRSDQRVGAVVERMTRKFFG